MVEGGTSMMSTRGSNHDEVNTWQTAGQQMREERASGLRAIRARGGMQEGQRGHAGGTCGGTPEGEHAGGTHHKVVVI